MFLTLTVIFWEFALGAWLLSRWFFDTGWSVLGLLAKILEILLAVLTISITVIFLVGWIMQLIRVSKGRK